MKSESYIITNENVKVSACLRIKDLLADGKTKVTISDAGSKSSRQRGLDWQWNTDVADSGMGGKFEDTKDNVHRVSKFKWAIPIFNRDDTYFAELYGMWIEKHGGDPEMMRYFVDNHVHTEKFTSSQMAEYMTEKQRHYLGVGVQLTDPDDLKLLMYEELNGR